MESKKEKELNVKQQVGCMIYHAFDLKNENSEFFSTDSDYFPRVETNFKFNESLPYCYYELYSGHEYEPCKLISFKTRKVCLAYYEIVLEEQAEKEFERLIETKDFRNDANLEFLVNEYSDYKRFYDVSHKLDSVTAEQRKEGKMKMDAFRLAILSRYVGIMNYDAQYNEAMMDITGQDMDNLMANNCDNDENDFSHIECEIERGERRVGA